MSLSSRRRMGRFCGPRRSDPFGLLNAQCTSIIINVPCKPLTYAHMSHMRININTHRHTDIQSTSKVRCLRQSRGTTRHHKSVLQMKRILGGASAVSRMYSSLVRPFPSYPPKRKILCPWSPGLCFTDTDWFFLAPSSMDAE